MTNPTLLEILEGIQDKEVYRRDVLASQDDRLVFRYLLRNTICITSNTIKGSPVDKQDDYLHQVVFLVPEIASNVTYNYNYKAETDHESVRISFIGKDSQGIDDYIEKFVDELTKE